MNQMRLMLLVCCAVLAMQGCERKDNAPPKPVTAPSTAEPGK